MKKFILGAVFILLPSFASANFTNAISYGSSGSDVYALQGILIESGCLNHVATGYFGSLTATAVKCWQKQNGLNNTGQVDVQTSVALNKLLANASASYPTIQSSITATAPTSVACPSGYTCTATVPTQTVSQNINQSTGQDQYAATQQLLAGNQAIVQITSLLKQINTIQQNYYSSMNSVQQSGDTVSYGNGAAYQAAIRANNQINPLVSQIKQLDAQYNLSLPTPSYNPIPTPTPNPSASQNCYMQMPQNGTQGFLNCY